MYLKECIDLLYQPNQTLVLINYVTKERFEFTNFSSSADDLFVNAYVIESKLVNDILKIQYFYPQKHFPYIALAAHPLETHVYWKDQPDKILATHMVKAEEIYQLVWMDYTSVIKEAIIELPINLSSKYLDFFHNLGFSNIKSLSNKQFSLIFTNHNRFVELENPSFWLYDMTKYSKAKNPNIKTVSNQIWKNLIKVK